MAELALDMAEGAGLELTWLGTAGFRVCAGSETFLIDPYLSRNPRARPIQELKPGDIRGASRIFISHGHFDHILDVPAIANRLGVEVHCHSTQAQTLVRDGLAPELVQEVDHDGQTFEFGGFAAQARFSRHVKFDLPLILKTLARVNFRLFNLLPLVREYPHGQVLAWKFDFKGRSLCHFGSAGSGPEELAALSQEDTDILLIPLQGHSRICDMALEYVRALQPQTVIPHHQDDFYPPISMSVNIEPFVQGLKSRFPEVGLVVPKMNQVFTL